MGFHLDNRCRTMQMRLMKEDSSRLWNNSISDLKFFFKNVIERCDFSVVKMTEPECFALYNLHYRGYL